MLIRLKKAEKEKQIIETNFQIIENKINTLQLDNIEGKLNPHLFKNILNSIQSHAYQTYFAMDKLANVLDYILYESRHKFVTPREEVEFALNLIEINKIKISPLFELKVKTKIQENEALYEQAILAPLISIDLIENAFKHADLQSSDAFIAIVFELKDNVFSLTVSNKISESTPIKKDKSGIGSKTLQQRLSIIYKENLSLSNEIHTFNVGEHEKESFTEIKEEAKKLDQPITTLYKVTNDIDSEIAEIANKGEFDLLLVGVGQSIYEGSLLGKILGITTRIINPDRILSQVTGKENLFENSPFDEHTSQVIAKSKVPVGVLLDKGLSEIKNVFIPIFSENDAFLINYAQKLINNSGAQVTIIDAEQHVKNTHELKEMIRLIEQTAPNHIHIISKKVIQRDFLKEQHLMLVSIESWKNLIASKSLWLSDIPSALVISNEG